jgi:hypothetical protein
MSWPSLGLAAGLALLGAVVAGGCTQDFGQFDPDDSAGPAASSEGPGPTSGSGGDGGAPASSSSASAGGAGATGSGGTAGSGGAPGVEDCLNGRDDDGDGDVDCGDSDCVPGHECLAEPPLGWEGYARAEATAFSDADPPPCPGGGDAESLYSDPAPATCTACACDAPDAACAAPPVSVWIGSTTCSSANVVDITGGVDDGQCYEPTLSSASTRSMALTGPSTLLDPGTCATSGGELTVTASWETRVAVCEVSGPFGGGCADGVCAPAGSGDYDGPACISRSGEEPCPAGWPAQTIVYADAVDDRQCGACACGAASGSTCGGGSYTIYDLDGCNDANTVVIDSTTCVDVSDQWEMSTGSALATLPVAAGGSCAASGGAATGAVTGLMPRTICCQ